MPGTSSWWPQLLSCRRIVLPTLFHAQCDGRSIRSRAAIQPTTFRLRDGCSASIWTAPDGSSLLTLDASSVQTAPDGSRRIVWMIREHPMNSRMPRQADPTPPGWAIVCWARRRRRALRLDGPHQPDGLLRREAGRVDAVGRRYASEAAGGQESLEQDASARRLPVRSTTDTGCPERDHGLGGGPYQ